MLNASFTKWKHPFSNHTPSRPRYSFSTEITELKTCKGLGLQDIITEVHTYVHRSE